MIHSILQFIVNTAYVLPLRNMHNIRKVDLTTKIFEVHNILSSNCNNLQRNIGHNKPRWKLQQKYCSLAFNTIYLSILQNFVLLWRNTMWLIVPMTIKSTFAWIPGSIPSLTTTDCFNFYNYL